MRENPVKKKLAAGQPVFGHMGWDFLTPALPQAVRAAGAEFLLMDMEHSGASFETLRVIAGLCRGIDLVPMARVPAIQYHLISRALDCGAMGIMLPMVANAQEAEFAVACTRYPPSGRRGAAFGFAHDDYLSGAVAEKIRIANERTLVICLIETAEGVRNVEKIAAVPGVDVLWIGHFDLTNFLGIPAQFDHPKYLKAIDKVVAAAKKHGKTLAIATGDESWSRRYWDKGFRLFAVGIDVHLLQGALRLGIEALAAMASEQPRRKA